MSETKSNFGKTSERQQHLFASRFNHLVDKDETGKPLNANRTPKKTFVLEKVEDIVTDESIDGKEINDRFSRLQVLLSSNMDDTQWVHTLNYLANHLEIIVQKWNCEQRFFNLLSITTWQLKVFNESQIIVHLLNLLFECFAYDSSYIQHAFKEIVIRLYSGNPKLKDEKIVSPEEKIVFSKLHNFTKNVLEMYPTFNDVVINAIKNKFPYYQVSSHAYLVYVINALMSLCYVKEKEYLFSFIANKLLLLDLTLFGNETKEEIFQMDMDIENHINLLDSSFDQLLNFTFYVIKKSGQTMMEISEFTKTYLEVFKKEVMSANDSLHMQYALIFLGSLDENIGNQVLDFLYQLSRNPKDQLNRRSVFYLASYLAKANFVSIDTFLFYVEKISNWIHHYIDENTVLGSSNFVCDSSKHNLFFSFCQALFYLISSRHNDFDENIIKFMRLQNFQRIISSNLNPLAACLPVIRDEFATVSRHYQLAMCSTVIERNRRLELDLSISKKPLDLLYFFPFEKFKLKMSADKIQPLLHGAAKDLLERKRVDSESSWHEIMSDQCSSFSPKSAFISNLMSESTAEEDDIYSMIISPC